MQVRDLRVALQEIEEVFAVAGAKPVQKDLTSVLELLSDKDDLELSTFLEEVRRNLSDGKGKGGGTEWLRLLNEAGLNESSFKQTFAELMKAPGTKAEVLAIAEGYTGTKQKSSQSKNDLLKAIESEFYGRLYERDADKIAERARPW
jgi:hypothetical protein